VLGLVGSVWTLAVRLWHRARAFQVDWTATCSTSSVRNDRPATQSNMHAPWIASFRCTLHVYPASTTDCPTDRRRIFCRVGFLAAGGDGEQWSEQFHLAPVWRHRLLAGSVHYTWKRNHDTESHDTLHDLWQDDWSFILIIHHSFSLSLHALNVLFTNLPLPPVSRNSDSMFAVYRIIWTKTKQNRVIGHRFRCG